MARVGVGLAAVLHSDAQLPGQVFEDVPRAAREAAAHGRTPARATPLLPLLQDLHPPRRFVLLFVLLFAMQCMTCAVLMSHTTCGTSASMAAARVGRQGVLHLQAHPKSQALDLRRLALQDRAEESFLACPRSCFEATVAIIALQLMSMSTPQAHNFRLQASWGPCLPKFLHPPFGACQGQRARF